MINDVKDSDLSANECEFITWKDIPLTLSSMRQIAAKKTRSNNVTTWNGAKICVN